MKDDPTARAGTEMDIQARMCPQGHVYLYVGHTCLFLREEEFLEVAQIVHTVERHLLEGPESHSHEPGH